jgi:hypothetical protein
MSDNYTLYVQKMTELRAGREANRSLHSQLEVLFQVIRVCEARWALEDQVER